MSKRPPWLSSAIAGIGRLRSLLEARALYRHASVGKAPRALGAPHIENRGRLQIGDHFALHSLPVRSHLVVHRGASLRIGDGVSIAHGCGIACHSNIQIGDGTRLGAFTLLLDTDYHVPGNPSARAEPAPIAIGRGVQIGSHVTILRGSIVGDGAIVAPGSVVSGEIGPGAHVAGVPARLLSLAPTAERAASGSLEARVAQVAMRAFRLRAAPSMSDGPQQIASWDSLGALSFLTDLEAEFGITLHEQEAHSVQKLADVIPLVRRARRSAA